MILRQLADFRANQHIKDKLIFFSQNILKRFDEKSKTIRIMFDKAFDFDRVWHNGLLLKICNLVKIKKDFLEDGNFCDKNWIFLDIYVKVF